jgi:hypothetical protein
MASVINSSKKLRSVESLSAALQAGRDKLRLQHVYQDARKAGSLRAGNSGILTETGEFAGACPHIAHLRQLGIESEVPTSDKLIMFQMGVESENAVFRDLGAILPEGQILLREEETGIEWRTSNGTRVTGRPDGVIYDKHIQHITVPRAGYEFEIDDPRYLAPRTIEQVKLEPKYGIELKTVASFWTTREVLFEREPKLTALIQAAHYAWQLNIPYKLSYKNYVNQTFPSWAHKFIPKQGEPGSEHVSYNDKGEAKNVNPFEIVYELDFDEHGYCWYRLEGAAVWTKSIVRWQDIRRFYEFVSSIPETGKLGNKLTTVGCTGKKKSYSHCDMYCPIHGQFSHLEHNYHEWLSAIKLAAQQGKLTGESE